MKKIFLIFLSTLFIVSYAHAVDRVFLTDAKVSVNFDGTLIFKIKPLVILTDQNGISDQVVQLISKPSNISVSGTTIPFRVIPLIIASDMVSLYKSNQFDDYVSGPILDIIGGFGEMNQIKDELHLKVPTNQIIRPDTNLMVDFHIRIDAIGYETRTFSGVAALTGIMESHVTIRP